MSFKKLDLNNNTKNSEKNNTNGSLILKHFHKNKNSRSISNIMVNFLENLSKTQEIMQKDFDEHIYKIICFQKNRNKIMSKNNFMLSLSTSKFPLISNQYKSTNLSKIQTKNNEDFLKLTSIINTNKTLLNPEMKQLKKSNSDFNMNDIHKSKINKLFDTAISDYNKFINMDENQKTTNKVKQVHFNLDSEDEKYNVNNKEDSTENNNENENEDNLDKNILNKDNENLNEKGINQNSLNLKENNNEINNINNKDNKKNESTFIKKRKKKFKIDVIRGWEFHNGLNFNNFNEKDYIEDKQYQKNLISNQIDIIIDNANYLKLNYLNILENHVKNDDINVFCLMKLNKIIEETSSLLIEIGHLIIKDFETFVNLKKKLPSSTPSKMVDGIEVTDEKKEFGINIKILNQSLKYLSSSYEIYLILNSQVSNYFLPKKKLIKTRHFLNRARYNINNIIIISKKYIEEINYEKGIIGQFNEQKRLIENNEKINNRQYYGLNRFSKDGFNSGVKNDNYRDVIGQDKKRRLNNLLNSTNTEKKNFRVFNHKNSTGKHINLQDKMFNKLFEYMEPNIKHRFEALSVTQKKDKNKNLRKVYKYNF